MAAKFSMASGLFDSAAHVEASDRLQGAADELRGLQERREAAQRAEQQREEQDKAERERRLAAALEAKASAAADSRFVGAHNQEDVSEEEDDSDDELLMDPELERLRAQRLAQLKKEVQQEQELRARGHGEYREIAQDEFLREVTSAPLSLVHFYHRDFERCKIMDMHLARLAPRHVECKFLKMDAEKAPFFVEKLAIRVLPTVVCFRDGVAFPERVVGFEGLADSALSDEQRELQAFGSRSANRRITSSDEFPTSALEQKLADIGAVHARDADSDDERS